MAHIEDFGHMTLKRRIAIAAASSSASNCRGLESPWYGPWGIVLQEITSSIDNAIVIPQDTLWNASNTPKSSRKFRYSERGISLDVLPDDKVMPHPVSHLDGDPGERAVKGKWEGGEMDAEDSDTEDSEVDADETTGQQETAHDNYAYNEAADTSADSAITIHCDHLPFRSPDFTVLPTYFTFLPRDDPRYNQKTGIKIRHQTCAVVVENKKSVTRMDDEILVSPFSQNIIRNSFVAALSSVREQCSFAFKKYPACEHVVAIAAVGAYWMHAFVRRDVLFIEDRMAQETEWSRLWMTPVELYSIVAQRRLAAIRRYIKAKSTIQPTRTSVSMQYPAIPATLMFYSSIRYLRLVVVNVDVAFRNG